MKYFCAFFLNECATTWAYHSVKIILRIHDISEICLYFQVLLAPFLVLLFYLDDY